MFNGRHNQMLAPNFQPVLLQTQNRKVITFCCPAGEKDLVFF